MQLTYKGLNVYMYTHTYICTLVYGLNICNLMILEINVLLIHP